MHIDTEYIFLAGKDYFIKQNKISFVQDMSLNYMRECVFPQLLLSVYYFWPLEIV